MLMIGSRSLSLRIGEALRRSPVDFDFICTQDEYDQWLTNNKHKVNPTEIYPEGDYMIVKGDGAICEFEIIKPGGSSELLAKLVKDDPETLETSFSQIPSLNLLFAVKDSHKYKKFETTRGCA